MLAWMRKAKKKPKKQPTTLRGRLVSGARKTAKSLKEGAVKAEGYRQKLGEYYWKVQEYAEKGQRELDSRDLFGLKEAGLAYGPQPTRKKGKRKKVVVAKRPSVAVLILGEEEED